MRKRTSSILAALATGAAALFTAAPAGAQAWHYPVFEPPRIAEREFVFGVAGGGDDYGTTGIFQWREGIGPATHLRFDAGIASPDGTTLVLLGGAIAQELARATRDVPLDVVLTGGIQAGLGDDFSVIRLPIGVVVGHTFPLEGQLALTPYAHPRLSIDVCASDCGNIDTELNVLFDLGLNLVITQRVSLRTALHFGAVSAFENEVGFGLGLAIQPASVRR